LQEKKAYKKITCVASTTILIANKEVDDGHEIAARQYDANEKRMPNTKTHNLVIPFTAYEERDSMRVLFHSAVSSHNVIFVGS